MAKILEYFGIVFYFYSNEHLPIHVHVSYDEYESIFEIIFEDGLVRAIEVRKAVGKDPFPTQQFREAQAITKLYATEIVNRWTEFFVLKKKIKTL